MELLSWCNDTIDWIIDLVLNVFEIVWLMWNGIILNISEWTIVRIEMFQNYLIYSTTIEIHLHLCRIKIGARVSRYLHNVTDNGKYDNTRCTQRVLVYYKFM